jgi:hypothetical protein
MSEQPAAGGALDALLAVRAEKFPDVPVEVLERVYEIEQAAQFESDRKPTVAKLRALIMDEGEA